MSGEELKAAAWRYEKNGVVALHSNRKPLYLTPGMGEWTETPLYAHPLPEQHQEGVGELIAWLEALSEKQRHERGCAFYFGEPDPQIAQCIAALSPPSTETKESGDAVPTPFLDALKQDKREREG